MLAVAVIVAGDRAGADVHLGAHLGVADIGQMADLGPPAEPCRLDLDEVAGLGRRLHDGARTQPGEGPDRGVRLDPGAVQMAEGMYHRARGDAYAGAEDDEGLDHSTGLDRRVEGQVHGGRRLHDDAGIEHPAAQPILQVLRHVGELRLRVHPQPLDPGADDGGGTPAPLPGQGHRVGEVVLAALGMQAQGGQKRSQPRAVHGHDAGVADPVAAQIVVGVPLLDDLGELALDEAEPAVARGIGRLHAQHRHGGRGVGAGLQQAGDGLGQQQRRVAVENGDGSFRRQQRQRRGHGIAGAAGQGLDRHLHGRAERPGDLGHGLHAGGEHDDDPLRRQGHGGAQDMAQDGQACQRVQHLGQRVAHTRALACGEDHDAQRLGHAWFGSLVRVG